MPDFIDIEILEDGTLSVTTGDISETNHISADELILDLEKNLGGERKTKKREHPFMKNAIVHRGGKITRKT